MRRVTGLLGLKCLVSRLVDKMFLRLLNSSSCSGSHWKNFPLPRSCRIAIVACEKSGIKNASCCAIPKKDLTSVTFFGVANCLMAFTLSGLLGFRPLDHTSPCFLVYVRTSGR